MDAEEQFEYQTQLRTALEQQAASAEDPALAMAGVTQ